MMRIGVCVFLNIAFPRTKVGKFGELGGKCKPRKG